jgi:hypothetical protein
MLTSMLLVPGSNAHGDRNCRMRFGRASICVSHALPARPSIATRDGSNRAALLARGARPHKLCACARGRRGGGMDSRLLKIAVTLSFLLLAKTGFAHHSPIAFDTSVTDFAISGEIEYVDMRNPHSVMRLKVAAEDGNATVWDIEFSSVNLLLRRGWVFERIKVGDRVTCIGNPSATGKAEMYMWSIMLPDGTEFGR